MKTLHPRGPSGASGQGSSSRLSGRIARWLPWVVAAFLLATLVVSGWAQTVTVRSGSRHTQESYVLKSVGEVPLGTVLDYWDFSPIDATPPPEGYALCDGNPVSDPESPYYGMNTPDLTGQFVMGTNVVASIDDDAGGSDTLNLAHAHTVAGSTQFASNSGQYNVSPFGGTLLTPPNHTHPFSGTSDTALSSTPGNNLPPYARLLKIVRIK